ncbi:MAG: bifunctional (p)ppGpp synthetase/guanosine-3',5'-bis(diphosphate) 3'-pyrophosphohydrolase [Fimbriimonadaceae bacterium]|nr:bifunctional (p)ppGpp synthetase/guanosine-3',5'-bis(diphosphate) 3'-pyrophosphohydrolase [Fimbriimonadaceae bacterium]
MAHLDPSRAEFWPQEDLQDLLETVRRVKRPADYDRLTRGWELACRAHEGQRRKTGEAYVHHPIAVAKTVASPRVDDDGIIAALLHDVVEDTVVSSEEIEAAFGPDVRQLVDGVTKLDVPESAGPTSSREAENLRRMLLAMARDFRVMLIKLSDRLHNLQTIHGQNPESQTKKANETLEVFAPLAARLGVWQLKWQLEDLAFKVLHPEEFRRISNLVAQSKEERDRELNAAMAILRTRLDERGLGHALLMGRTKHLFSIYNKMVKQDLAFEEILDLSALRILLNTPTECYVAMGVVHELWRPMQGKDMFFDYIGSPKPNGYQSIHTKVLGANGQTLEVQIRTHRMHEVAEFGVAAHWSYKEGRPAADTPAQFGQLRRQLDEISRQGSGREFLRDLSTDVFSDQVFVRTPKGDVIELPLDSTPIDFAFRIHTDLGLKTTGAKVNGTMVPLHTKLQNGDVVQLITRTGSSPSPDWLKFTKSRHARAKLKAYFRRRGQERNAADGRQAIVQELRRQGLDPRAMLSEENLAQIAAKMRGKISADLIFARVGEGLTSVHSVVQKLKELSPSAPPPPPLETLALVDAPPESGFAPSISGRLDNVLYRRGKCCLPIPGDEVAGYVSRGRGIILHRTICPNLLGIMEQEKERIQDLTWEAEPDGVFPVMVKITALDRDGLLHDVTACLAESKTGVLSAKVKTLPNTTAEFHFGLNIRDVRHLREVSARISRMADVISVTRLFGKA